MRSIGEIGKKCCGCHSCQYSCPTDAITLQEDEEGFLYPVVNEAACVECGKCRQVCPILNPICFSQEQEGYAAYLKNTEHLRKSTSGGVFYALADHVLRQDGCVFGCGYDHLMPKHIMVSDHNALAMLQGSKYVQSAMKGVYPQVEQVLHTGRRTLFSGTPCQVAGLRKYLRKEYDNLFCVDVICHGTPSREMYRQYLDWLGEKHGGIVTKYDFRSKDRNDWSLTLCADIQRPTGKVVHIEKIASLDPYYYAFLQANTYRESCYACPYAQLSRPGDITLGDFWGIAAVLPDMNNPNGASAVLVNSEKGKQLLDAIKELLVYRPVDPVSIQRNNGNLRAPSARPALRDAVYQDMNAHGFAYVAKKCMVHPRWPVEAARNMLSNKTRQRIKALLRRRS